MELNINSPAYYTAQYGVIDEIYTMCRGLSAFVKEKHYSDFVDIVGITPIIAPKEVIYQGLFSEVKKCDLKYGFASISLQIDYDMFMKDDIEEKKMLIIENIVASMEVIHKKAKLDIKAFQNDVKEYLQQIQGKVM